LWQWGCGGVLNGGMLPLGKKVEKLYRKENFQQLARLLIKTWQPTESIEEQFEVINRAIYLVGSNSRGVKLLEEMRTELCAS
jgi:hypothetical protein